MKELILTRGKIALVDDDDYDSLKDYHWRATPSKNTWYARRDGTENGKAVVVYLHRDIMRAKKGQQIEHKDRNGLNCQKTNLRFSTQSQNLQNTNFRGGQSGFKGVTRSASKRERWLAQIFVNGKKIYLGSFDRQEEAAVAYDTAAIEHFCEFACTNKSLGLLTST